MVGQPAASQHALQQLLQVGFAAAGCRGIMFQRVTDRALDLFTEVAREGRLERLAHKRAQLVHTVGKRHALLAELLQYRQLLGELGLRAQSHLA
eukprot:7369928-Prymnesium_polylepis.1